MARARPVSLILSRCSLKSAFGAGAAIWHPETQANTARKTKPSLQPRTNQERVPIDEAPFGDGQGSSGPLASSLYPTTTSILLGYRTESTRIRSEKLTDF